MAQVHSKMNNNYTIKFCWCDGKVEYNQNREGKSNLMF